jgi:hypothetical protein
MRKNGVGVNMKARQRRIIQGDDFIPSLECFLYKYFNDETHTN